MGRRNNSEPQDPKVEEASTELESIVGQKKSVEAEITSTVTNKKRLEQEYEDRKREIEDDLAIRKREVEKEKANLDNQNLFLRDENKKLEQSKQILQKEHDTFVIIIKTISEQSERDKKALEIISSDVARLTKEKNELQQSINNFTPQVVALESKIAVLQIEYDKLEKAKKETTTIHTTLSTELVEIKKSHSSLTASKDIKQKEINDLDVQIKDTKDKLIIAQSELAEIVNLIQSKKEDLDKRETDLNTRMGNAQRLEVHVSEKLDHLKEIEKQFTNEHLARVGYKKTE